MCSLAFSDLQESYDDYRSALYLGLYILLSKKSTYKYENCAKFAQISRQNAKRIKNGQYAQKIDGAPVQNIVKFSKKLSKICFLNIKLNIMSKSYAKKSQKKHWNSKDFDK